MSTVTERTFPSVASSCSVRTPRPVSMCMRVLRDTADAVAAHLRLAAVGVEHAHPHVAPLRGADENQTVRADAEVPVANRAAQRSRIARRRMTDAIDVDVVVADAVHFG